MSNQIEQKQENVAPEVGNQDQVRKHDLFRDPALASSLQEDPVATFLLANWKILLVSLLAICGFFYFKSQIEFTADSRVAESSETFDKARSAVISLLDAQSKKTKQEKASNDTSDKANQAEDEKLLRSAMDSLNALKSGPEPYAILAPIYENLLEQADAKASSLPKIEWDKDVPPGERLALELQEFILTKKLLDSSDGLSEAVSRLSKLAQSAVYVRAPAALTLLRVVESPEDRAAAISIGQDVAKIYPEQASRIETELKRLS